MLTTTTTPPGWPVAIAITLQEYKNWSWQIDVPKVWTCSPRSADDVVAACNWATENGSRVRPRRTIHGGSPLTIDPTALPASNVLLVDTTQFLTPMTFIPRTA